MTLPDGGAARPHDSPGPQQLSLIVDLRARLLRDLARLWWNRGIVAFLRGGEVVVAMHAVEHRGCRIAWRERGAGPPVLWIQDAGVHGDGWAPQVDALLCEHFERRGANPASAEPRAVQ